MKVTFSSKTLVDFQEATCSDIPDGRLPHKHHCENLKSYKCSLQFEDVMQATTYITLACRLITWASSLWNQVTIMTPP
jgi:hypothetical protein